MIVKKLSEKKNPFLNCMRKNESCSLKEKLKIHKNGYRPVHAKVKSQKINSGLLRSSRPLRTKKKHFPDFIQNFGYKRKQHQKVIDLESLKKSIVDGKGPAAMVVLKRLSDKRIQKSISKTYGKSIHHKKTLPLSSTGREGYEKPAYVLSGHGTKLKDIPGVEDNVRKASNQTIYLIHNVLFGTTEKNHLCRVNILEFNGYSQLQKNFIAHSNRILNKMSHTDIKSICKTFLLNVKGCSEVVAVGRLSQFLLAPSTNNDSSLPKETVVQLPPVKLKDSSPGHQHSVEPAIGKTPMLNHSNNTEDSHQTFEIKPSLKLQDLENVCFNIECAAPEDLIELNDLLFIKPSDSTEIHNKILDFTYFSFNESSIEYHYRKTLLNYMNCNILKKIAILLDIPNSEDSSHPELSSDIFKFLMEPKQKNMKSKSRNKSIGMENKSSTVIENKSSNVVENKSSNVMENKSSNVMENKSSNVMENKSSSIREKKSSNIMEEKSNATQSKTSNLMESRASNVMESKTSNVMKRKPYVINRNRKLNGRVTKSTNTFVNSEWNHVENKVRNFKFGLNEALRVTSESDIPLSQCSDHAYSMSCEEKVIQECGKKDRNPLLTKFIATGRKRKCVLSEETNKKPTIKLTRSPLITRVQAL